MSSYQFTSLMAVLWLIASNQVENVHFAIGCTVLFIGYSTGAVWAVWEEWRHD